MVDCPNASAGKRALAAEHVPCGEIGRTRDLDGLRISRLKECSYPETIVTKLVIQVNECRMDFAKLIRITD